ncbi:hypothetical protein PYW08_011206 [Mythimna loreyi]|uniref:Uncharacterized protein n=1 Tax=Mythimna loreyi TaxID=667449 RepID=A0ACC2Q5E5_9NEOP|nr:hypothetical protein PYW08_011206 [Mythimna loreyi]
MKLFCILLFLFVANVYANKDIADICKQPIVQGLCLAYFPRYAYNCHTGKCERFIYGGCGGNENNFMTMRECCKACHVRDE